MDKAKNNKSLAFGVSGILLQIIGMPASILVAESSPGMEDAALILMLGAWALGTCLLIAGLSYYAQAKDQSGWWGLMGLLGIIGLIALALLPDKHAQALKLARVPNRVSDLPDANSVEFRCLGCGYQLNGTVGNACPECGRGFDPDDLKTVNVVGLEPLKAPWMGRWSVICGTLGLCVCGPVVPIIGVVFGHLALNEIKRSQPQRPGRTVAIVGLVFSYIGVVLGLIMFANMFAA